MMGDDDGEFEGLEVSFELKTTHEVKLRELLHNINSIEIKICSAAAKDFIKLLKGNSGGKLLQLYVQTTSNFSELLGAWKLQQGKPGLRFIFSLISMILSHPDGKCRLNGKERIGVSRVIDKFARGLIEEKLDVIQNELCSKEWKHQNAALLLLASIVKRGSGFASEVAKNFNFKLPAFLKIAHHKQRKNDDKKRKQSSRKAFVGFAMSFLEEGKPGLLRWVLQQREMYCGVLRGIGNDEEETVTYILSTLRDRVLCEDSLVPPSLRSVLFGIITLEQLVGISARENGGPAVELAYDVLLLVCTDPGNGLMPDLDRRPNPLKGNAKRLLGLMKKLKATEIDHHRDLLLAIVRGRPSFGSAYLEEFPYNLEDYASPTWLATVSLAANIVSSVRAGHPFGFLDSWSHEPPSFDSVNVQNIMNCISPRLFNRAVINKGLLHSDYIVKNGTLRLVLETLKLLESFFKAMDFFCSRKQNTQQCALLKQEIQNTIRSSLPDPQVLVTQLSSSSSNTRADKSCLKRTADKGNFDEHGSKRKKKVKTDIMNDDTDIIVGGITSTLDINFPGDSENIDDAEKPDDLDSGKDFVNFISELWGSDLCFVPVTSLKDVEIFFCSKLLDALKIYLLTIPAALEESIDFFMNLWGNLLELPTYLQHSLLSLLVEYIEWSPRDGIAVRNPPLMYKHLQAFVNLLIFSPTDEIKAQACNLARAAMSSTGAFDRNIHEIDVWFLFLPGYCTDKSSAEIQVIEVLQSMSPIVISFLCDAISTIGNNLFRYWDILRNQTYHLKGFKDVAPEFSPLPVCALQKCIRLLNSESRTFSLPEKTLVSVYVCNTLKYLLQIQVDAGLLAALIMSVLSEGLKGRCSLVDNSAEFFCEWRPLKNLLLFAESVSRQQACCFSSFDQKAIPTDGSFTRTLGEVQKILERRHSDEMAGTAKAFLSSVTCASSDEILSNFPKVMAISQCLQVPVSLLLSIIFLEQSFLAGVLKLWPKVLLTSLENTSVANPRDPKDDAFAENLVHDYVFGSNESVVTSEFSLFLRQAPFHVLFPIVMHIDISYLSEPLKIKDLLLAKLSEWKSDNFVSYLRLLLFWFRQIQSSYRIARSTKLEQLAEICYSSLKHMLGRLLVLKPDSECLIQELAQTIVCHPAMVGSLACPLSCNEHITEENCGNSLEAFLCFWGKSVHKIGHYVLDLLTATFDDLLFPPSGLHSILTAEDGASKHLVKTFNTLIKTLCLQLRENFDVCIRSKSLLPIVPSFYTLHSLIRFISPFELLELVRCIFGKVDVNSLTGERPCWISVFSVGFFVAGDAFDILSTYFCQHIAKRGPLYFFWGKEDKSSNASVVEEIYIKVCKFAINFEMEVAYICLLKAINSVYRQKYVPQDILHPFYLELSRVITNSPAEIVSQCIYKTSVTKAKLLFLLVEMSPLHLSISGHVLSGILKEKIHLNGKTEEMCGSPSDEDFMMLLPASLSYLNSTLIGLDKQYCKQFTNIASFYSKLLLNGFQHWKSFVSGYIFQENFDEFLPSSVEDVLNLVEGSLLGKAIRMLEHNFAFGGDMKIEGRLKLFNSIFTYSAVDEKLLDCDVCELDFFAVNQSLNFVNRVVAKIILSRMLLFPKDDRISPLHEEAHGQSNEISSEMFQSRMQFLKILVDAWQCMVKKFPSVLDHSTTEKDFDCLRLYRYMELFILRTILELTVEMHDGLIQLQSIPFLEQLMRSSLLYRFEDPTTLKILCSILTILGAGNFSCVLYLQLLLAHSQFALTIRTITTSSSSQIGALFRPMSSILRSLIFHPENKNGQQTNELYLKQLEVVKLLRVLLQLWCHQSGGNFGEDIGINLNELHSLLLSSYGATLNEIDLEIYRIMQEIESIDNSVSEDFAKMDYLWGSSALKMRKEQAFDREIPYNMMSDNEEGKKYRRSQFRENIPIDPKMCVSTVLYFPYDRNAIDEPLSLNSFQTDNLKDIYETRALDVKSSRRYDPVFILHFSIHVLLMGYLEPIEYASLGLLAVAFMSISSPDVAMRKLGYEFLGRYKNALEKSKKRTDMQLRLLLTHIQNGIEEPWQRIPCFNALFAAESSFILLDPSHDHYTILCKHLTDSSRVNMKSIPLFHTLFKSNSINLSLSKSNSINLRTERLWILRLAYAGLSLDDDAQIFRRNSIIETLLSFYASCLLDNESKELILQIVKKSVKLHKLATYLVEHCGLISWLSSVLSTFSEMSNEDEKCFLSQQLIVVVEVVADIVSIRNISEWLQQHSLEQLMDLISLLYKLLVGGLKLMKENSALVYSIMHTMMFMMKISQKRKIYQPHFTLSFEGLFQLYQAIDIYNTERSTENAEIGLNAILMSTPPVNIFHTDQKKLSSFLMWAVSTALKANSQQSFYCKESHTSLTMISEKGPCEECLISKLLRWLVASVILGKLSWKNNVTKFSKEPNPENLQSFLDYVGKDFGESNKHSFDSEEVLSATILYLQQLLGVNFAVLPSVVSALCLLLFCDASKYSDFRLDYVAAVMPLCSKIRSPPESNPTWRWSFYQPWKDLSTELNDSNKMAELHASQMVLVIVSNVVGKKPLESQILSYQDVASLGVFEWERSIVETEQ